MQYRIATAPTTYPISLAEAKLHLRVTTSEEENRITALIKSATDQVESYLRRQLITATWDLYLDEFPDVIYLEKSPIASVSYVKYYNSSNTLTTLSTDDYVADTYTEPGRVMIAYGKDWPDTYDRPSAVNVRFIAGYGAAATVPDTIKDGIYMTLTHLFENRGDEGRRMPYVIKDVLEPYRVFQF
jgi:uncharacterized phiE125 gp8 family phage protein